MTIRKIRFLNFCASEDIDESRLRTTAIDYSRIKIQKNSVVAYHFGTAFFSMSEVDVDDAVFVYHEPLSCTSDF